MERDRRDEIEGRWAERDTGKKKKLSLIEQQREKYARRGVAKVGGVKERKKKDVDDVSWDDDDGGGGGQFSKAASIDLFQVACIPEKVVNCRT